jgi:hypothetical protein
MSQAKVSQRCIRVRKRSSNAKFLGHLPEEDAPEDIFKQLASEFRDYLHPKHYEPSWIEMTLPMGHPDLDRLLARAQELGLSIPKDGSEESKGLKITDFIVYSEREIEEAHFVECQRFSPFIASISQIESGPIERIASDRYIKQCKNRYFGSFVNLYHLLAVRGKALKVLQKANLKGLTLIRLEPDQGWPEGIEPLHLIWSESKFPPLDEANYVEKPGKWMVEKLRVDGYRKPPRLHYLTREVPDLDVALTHEQFWKTPHYHRVIFSRKARAVLQSLDKNLSFIPVVSQ